MKKSILFLSFLGLFLTACGPKDEYQFRTTNHSYLQNPETIRMNNENAAWIKQNFNNVGRAFVYSTNEGNIVELVLKRNITQNEFELMGKDIANHIRTTSNTSSVLVSELGVNSAVLRAKNF